MLIGLILPLSAYFIADVLLKNATIAGKPGVPYLIAVAINLIFLKYIYKAGSDKAGTGLLVITFIILLLTFTFKIKLR